MFSHFICGIFCHFLHVAESAPSPAALRCLLPDRTRLYLYPHGGPDDHGFLQQALVELGGMVVEVQHGDEDLGQAVLPLPVLRLHVEVVLGAGLRVQRGPGLGGDQPRGEVDGEPGGAKEEPSRALRTKGCLDVTGLNGRNRIGLPQKLFELITAHVRIRKKKNLEMNQTIL